MKVLCVFGQHNYGDPARGLSYEYVNFLPALERLGHTVAFFDSWNRSYYGDFAELNRRLLETIERVRPDVIFLVLLAYEVWLETLDHIRQRSKSVVVNWGTDDSWKYEQFTRWFAPMLDVHATTAKEAMQKSLRDGIPNVVLTQWAANSVNLAEPLPASQCTYAVSFVGSAYGNRPQRISGLRKKGIEVTCFGYGWPNGPIQAEGIPLITRRSVISLNFAESGLQFKSGRLYRSSQIKARVFEVPGSGGFLLTEKAPHLEQFYSPDREVVTFESADELYEKIVYFLAHPERRDTIARAGYERTIKDHTYESRFSKLFWVAARMAADSGRASAAKDCLDYHQWFPALQARHAPNRLIRSIRRILVGLLSAIFGRQRGPRAARRLIHELSWRICREKTYTAAGLPGRMFYRELE